MKICTSCQAANSQEANFCSLCRTPFERSSRGAYCAKGHAMHPSWPECLECRGERSMVQDFGSVPPRMPTLMEPGAPSSPRGATVVESFGEPQHAIAIPIPPLAPGHAPPGHATAPANVPNPGPPNPIPPRGSARTPDQGPVAAEGPNSTSPFGVAPPSVSRRVTQYTGAAAPVSAPVARGVAPGAASPAAPATEKRPGRRIVGILLTYTWRPEGQIFPVREGRNLIGRNPDSDIAVVEDPHLSDTNAHITYRRNFTIGDMVSMSGTDLNGEPVEENFAILPNYSQIRMGSTHFTFIAAEPSAGSTARQE